MLLYALPGPEPRSGLHSKTTPQFILLSPDLREERDLAVKRVTSTTEQQNIEMGRELPTNGCGLTNSTGAAGLFFKIPSFRLKVH
jgi:hypothetical protein